LTAVWVASSTCTVGAATYDFDASLGGVFAVGLFITGPGAASGGSGLETAQFVFSAGQYQLGDIINFGTVSLGPPTSGTTNTAI
jgi:hypothetical protein